MLTNPLQGVAQRLRNSARSGCLVRIDLSNRTQLSDSEHQALESEFAKPFSVENFGGHFECRRAKSRP